MNTHLASRIEKFVQRDTITGCWEWSGSRGRDGYGKIRLDGATQEAHRASFSAHRGEIAEGLELDHLCRNRACVNPDHLEPVTHRENCLRGTGPIARNAAATFCVNGHPFDDSNTYRRPNGQRDCRICINNRVKAYKARKASA